MFSFSLSFSLSFSFSLLWGEEEEWLDDFVISNLEEE